LTLFNPDAEYIFEEKNIKSLSKNSAFVGKKMKGEVYGVVAKGEVVLG
jgi:dihydroorotase